MAESIIQFTKYLWGIHWIFQINPFILLYFIVGPAIIWFIKLQASILVRYGLIVIACVSSIFIIVLGDKYATSLHDLKYKKCAEPSIYNSYFGTNRTGNKVAFYFENELARVLDPILLDPVITMARNGILAVLGTRGEVRNDGERYDGAKSYPLHSNFVEVSYTLTEEQFFVALDMILRENKIN